LRRIRSRKSPNSVLPQLKKTTTKVRKFILIAEKTEKLFWAAAPEIIPFLALHFFAGIRRVTLEKLDGSVSSHGCRRWKLEELACDLEESEEDGVYRFYHGSNKVFFLQDPVKEAFTLIKEIGGESDPPNFEYARIVEAGTAHQFSETTNENWEAETKPILDASSHTKYSINMMVKYAKELETVESPLEPGVVAVLYLWVEMIKRDGTGSFPKASEKESPND
jgi:hypothetical protein